MPLLNAEDPRLRHTGVMALAGMFKGSPMPVDQITPQMWERLGEIIEDPNESWWVTQEAVHALGRANPAIVARHTDRLVQLLEHDSWWLNMAAGNTLATIATDPKHYKNVLPKVIGHVTGSVTIQQMRPASRLTDAIKSANPEVKAYAMKLLVDAYEGVPDEVKTPQGMVLTNLARTIRARLADMILLLPNGSDFALKTPKKTLASARSGNASDMYVHRGFKLDKSFVGKWHFLAKMSETDDIGKVAQRARDSIAQRKINSPTGRNAYRPVYLVLKDGGQLGKTTFWSGDMYIDALSGEARKMSVRKLDGKEYLLIEEGEFPDVFPEDWKPRYSLYEREQ
jgi:hypothetical protein